MTVNQCVNSIFNSCTYIVAQDGHSWLVDCGDVEPVLPLIDGKLCGVLLTHAHFDHIYGLNRLLAFFPEVAVYTNDDGKAALLSDKLNLSRYHETPFVFDRPENIRLVQDGEQLDLSPGLAVEAVFTPGHAPSCVTWVTGQAVFSGDSYIPGVKTVTMFPHADKERARHSEERIIRLAAHRSLYPGHAVNDEQENLI